MQVNFEVFQRQIFLLRADFVFAFNTYLLIFRLVFLLNVFIIIFIELEKFFDRVGFMHRWW